MCRRIHEDDQFFAVTVIQHVARPLIEHVRIETGGIEKPDPVFEVLALRRKSFQHGPGRDHSLVQLTPSEEAAIAVDRVVGE